ncbi:MAG: DUF92 domain-containing protein [Thermofilaceae archaeon]
MQPEQIAGAALTVTAVVIAKKHKALDDAGILAALVIALILLVLEAKLLLLMMLFFFTSSAFTFLGYERKEKTGAAERKAGRSASQVLCSGSVPAFITLAAVLLPPAERQALVLAAAASIAYANADTWAAEIGSLSRSQPVLITNPSVRVPHGVSGGVTVQGELGAVAGSAVIAAAAGLLNMFSPASIPLIFAMGWVGEIVDAIIGASLQIKYKCPKCNVLTDKEVHVCGARTVRAGGLKHVKNEIVNLLTESAVSLATFAFTLWCL